MKKLLFIINTLGCGGAERAMLNLFETLDSEEYDISLFVLTGQGELSRELPKNVRLLNKNYSNVSVLTKEGRKLLMRSVLRAGIGKGMFFRRAYYLLRNLFNMLKNRKILPDKLFWRLLADGAPKIKDEYDFAVAYLEGGATYYVADYVKAKKKAAFVHIDYLKAGYSRELDLDCYEKFDRIFTVSDEVKCHFLEVYPEYECKTSVFNNILNQTKIRETADRGEGFDDGFNGYRILTVGRLTSQKRYDIAIEAMKALKEKCSMPIRWYVLGEGELRESLEQQIKDYGLENDFILMGVKNNPYPYYKECDLYVHATEFEGKSIAIQEAQTLGKTILATDCSGNRESVENGVDGLLCELNPESVSDSILYMIKHPQACKSLGEAAKEKVLYNTKGLDEFLDLSDNYKCETKVLIIIPAYNEAENLKEVIERLKRTCPQYDYIIVNDGSTDTTEKLCTKNHYNIINIPVNQGLTSAIRTGLKYALENDYDAALQFDADGQHLPEYIDAMIECMEKTDCDIVIGSRFYKTKMPISMRTLGGRVISTAICATVNKRLTDPTSGMRLFKRNIIQAIVGNTHLAPEPDTLVYLIRMGADVREVQVRMEERKLGQSYLSPLNAAKYMIKVLSSIFIFQWKWETMEVTDYEEKQKVKT